MSAKRKTLSDDGVTTNTSEEQTKVENTLVQFYYSYRLNQQDNVDKFVTKEEDQSITYLIFLFNFFLITLYYYYLESNYYALVTLTTCTRAYMALVPITNA